MEPDSHISDKFKAVLDLKNYATTKELEHATDIDKSDLATKKDSIAMKTKTDTLHINKLFNVPASFNNLKTKVVAE